MNRYPSLSMSALPRRRRRRLTGRSRAFRGRPAAFDPAASSPPVDGGSRLPRSGFAAAAAAFAAAAALAAALAFPESAAAQNPGPSEEEGGAASLRVITVTAGRVLRDLMDVPVSVEVVTSEDIERQPYTNVNDVLAGIPGVAKSESSGARAGSSKISIRGAETAHTLFMIDGVKVTDKDDSQPALLIDLSQVERIEVIKGPASVLYGSEAIGGVVNVITKKGGERPLGFSQALVYDSSTESVDVRSSVFGRTGGLSYRFSGSGVNAHDRKVPSGSLDGSSAYSSSYRNRYFSAKIGYDWGAHSLTLSADRYENVSNYSIDGLASIRKSQRMRLDPNGRETVIASLALRELGERWKKLTVSLSRQKTSRAIVSDFRGGSTYALDSYGRIVSEQIQLSLSAQSEWSFPGHYLIAGLEYEGDDVRVANEAVPYDPAELPRSGRARVRQRSLDLFVQDEWEIIRDLKATLGARFSSIRGELAGRDAGTYMGLEGKKDSDSHLVGSLGLVYRGVPGLALRGLFSQGYRYPTVRQLYTGSRAHGGGTATYPNPALRPETSNNFELGARYQDEAWDVDLAVFHSVTKNIIQAANATYSGTGVRSFINGDRAVTVGAELFAAREFLLGEASLTPYVSGTWLKREITMNTGPSAGRSTANTLIPPFEGKFGLKLSAPLGGGMAFSGDLQAVMASEAKTSIHDPEHGRPLEIVEGAKSYPAWQTLNLTLGVSGGEELRYNVSLAFRNIFNQGYYDSRGQSSLPEPGFHVVLGVGLEY
ncbi:MAG: TonB-dependent receptor [Deltaproteobacteria bacterium]|jgi:hemoglobin/transferrin/lactoferrin receptor protein|nr:TonB-dependent receptor [Deltaproteobacteria bacterium]